MTTEIKAPTLPESVPDGTIATWYKQPGESASRDELLVDIETDKVVLEVVAPADGVLKDIKKAEGDTIVSNEVLAVFEEGEISQKSASADSTDGPASVASSIASAENAAPAAAVGVPAAVGAAAAAAAVICCGADADDAGVDAVGVFCRKKSTEAGVQGWGRTKTPGIASNASCPARPRLPTRSRVVNSGRYS